MTRFGVDLLLLRSPCGIAHESARAKKVSLEVTLNAFNPFFNRVRSITLLDRHKTPFYRCDLKRDQAIELDFLNLKPCLSS